MTKETETVPISKLLEDSKKLIPGKYIHKDGKSAKEKNHVSTGELVDDLLHDYIFKAYADTEEILVYQGGRYIKNGEKTIKNECERVVGNQLLTTHIVNEAIGHIQRSPSTYVDRKDFDRDPEIINLKNGLFNLNTNEFIEGHTPDYLSTIQIPVIYEPFAICPKIERFVSEVLNEQDIPLVYEIFGHCLVRDYKMQRAFLFVGDGSNGKSTFLELLRAFLGRDNCSSQSLQALEFGRFATAILEGKLANVFADLPHSDMSRSSMFKMLTGGDDIPAEEKFKSPYSFINYAKLLFSTNKPPTYDDDSYAFWRRWVWIDFPNKFEGANEDKDILQKLTTPEELSGLLNLALEALKKLQKKRQFSYTQTVEQVREQYKDKTDPLHAFINDWCITGDDFQIPTEELFSAYKEYCNKKGKSTIGIETFGKLLKNNRDFPGIYKIRPRIDGIQVYYWKGIMINDEAKSTDLA